jgi:Kef-type K+ transport system membrane component KefB
MTFLISLGLLIVVMILIRILPVLPAPQEEMTTYLLGFLLLIAYVFSRLALKIKLPRISGYILAGLVFGPYLVGLFSQSLLKNLYFINHLALAFIAFSAGGALKLEQLKKQVKSLTAITGLSILIIFFGVSFSVYLLRPVIPFLNHLSTVHAIGAAAIFGIISCARSPSSAIAIISETKAKGPVSETVLSVSIVMDVLIIILFAFIVSLCAALITPGSTFNALFLVSITLETLGAIIIGIVLGFVISFVMNIIHADLPVVIILLGVFVTRTSYALSALLKNAYDITLHIEPLLVCMAAGFSVVNFTAHGKTFLNSMTKVSLPIYALFFAVAGASINLEVLRSAWQIGLAVFFIRALALWGGISLGARLSSNTPAVRKYAWLGFITQAGVGLGLANEVIRRFPDWGSAVATIIIAVISINQIVGPVTFKYALGKGGEIKKG